MPARDQGAKAGAKIDQTMNQSYQEYGYKLGNKVDEMRTSVNEKFADDKGKTPEDHFRELYGASANLASNTYNYAWSWVPFTKQKAHNAKEYAKHTDAATMKEDAMSKGQEVKEKAKDTELPGETSQTLGGLVNEARGLAGQVLDTAVYYIKVAEEKADAATSDAKGTADQAKEKTKAKGNSYVDQARNLTAYVMERTSDIVTYGQQKAGEVADEASGKKKDAQSYAKSVKENGASKAGDVKDKVASETQTNGDRPHVAVSLQL